MPFITIQASDLTHEKKEMIANHLAQGFAAIGVPPQAVLVKFDDLHLEYVTESGLRCLDAKNAAPQPVVVASPVPAPIPPQEPAPRRKKGDQGALLKQLVEHFRRQPDMNSFDVQQALGLKHESNPGNAARQLLEELVAQGVITKTGQRRGTRYHFSPDPDALPEAPEPILVKQDVSVDLEIPATAETPDTAPEAPGVSSNSDEA